MSLEQVWTQAIESIADRNAGGIVQEILAERNRWKETQKFQFDVELRRRVLQLHPPSELDKLKDFVVYLVWAKFTRHWNGNGPDPFLGTSDLRLYLETRTPTPYPLSDVNAFLATLGPPTRTGDLRTWEYRMPKSSRFGDDPLDLHLLETELDELRRQPPPGIIAGLSSKDARHALRRFEKRPDRELRKCVPRCLPQRIEHWATLIAHELALGNCDCVCTHEETPRTRSAAETRCRHSHFLSRENLGAALAGTLPQQKEKIADPWAFVERAVLYKLEHVSLETMVQFKDFAHAMLCNHYITPRHTTLRKKTYITGTEVLTETGEYQRDIQELLADRETHTSPALLVVGCPICETFVGNPGSDRRCIAERHPWGYASLNRFGDLDSRSEEVISGAANIRVNVCKQGHFWPAQAKGLCPVCPQRQRRLPIATDRKVEVDVPSNRQYHDVDECEWHFELPGRFLGDPEVSGGES